MRKSAKLILLASALSIAPAAAQEDVSPPAPAPFSEDALARGKAADPARSYAEAFSVPAATARERLALQDEAVAYAQTLLASNPQGFVDLAIRHTPNFRIVIYYNKDIDRTALTSAAPVALRRYLAFNPIDRSRQGLEETRQSLLSALTAADVKFGLEYDLERQKFLVTIPQGSGRASYTAALPGPLKAEVELVEGALAQDIVALYAGWWFEAAGYCTAGWPVRNSAGQEGLITAGHCGPPNQMYFSWNGGPTLTNPYPWRDTDTTFQTQDWAIYPLGSHTTERVVYIQNGTTYNGRTNNVPGVVSAYYEITYPRQPVAGQYICKNGGTTGITCGVVVATNWSGDGYRNVVKVSSSAQPYIAAGGDSGGPVFTWSADGSMAHPVGIVIGAAFLNGSPCLNTTTDPGRNTTCYFVFLPLSLIRGHDPFTVNTVHGFVTP
jgi:hypothetical protein